MTSLTTSSKSKPASRRRVMPYRLRLLLATPTGVIAILILAALAVLFVIGPIIWGEQAEVRNVANALLGPSADHWFGTDELGRDIFARTMNATRLSLQLALLASLIAVCVGIPLGMAPAILGSWASRFVASIIGATLAFPALLTAMFVGVILGRGSTGAVVGIGLASVPLFARLAQTMSASIAELDYVSAARIMGIGRVRIMTRHILPNVAEPLIITGTISVAASLLGISTLSFLGLGVQAPEYDWGALLTRGLPMLYQNPLAAIGGGSLIAVAGIGFSLLGEAVSRTFGDQAATRSSLRIGRQMAKRAATARQAAAIRRAAAKEAGKASPATDTLVEAEALTVAFPGDDQPFYPVRGVDLTVSPGERIGVVGESGSGKTLTVMALAQLLNYPGVADWRELRILNADITCTSPRQLRTILGTNLAMVFQDPMSSLNPALRIGRQMSEVVEVHNGMEHKQALELSASKLSEVGIARSSERLRDYPHEFSGGMRQRVMIAMGLMETPQLIIADEPTTALDVTVQRQILDLLAEINTESGAAIVLISHDIAVVTTLCERVLVMYHGRIVEELPTARLTEAARHPYTRALVASVPDMTTDRTQPLATILGRPPAVQTDPVGCAFAERCEFATTRCAEQRPELVASGERHKVACWNPQGVAEFAAASGAGTGGGA
ncbi:MAG: dipeptide/oligopeptide/nickel ABC transporter permease/ATP-binding protein [Micrococcales bacterium]|nr:dipeptide/oligopeptide/nickel ABC transporter permease/ATP-binding protein [Micrococcales bacterium]